MNHDQSNNSPSDAHDVPDDLRDTDAMLNMLGATDRGAGDIDLEHRVWGGSLGQLHGVGQVEVTAESAAAMDRNAAPASLEAGVFEASRSDLARRHEPVLARINTGGMGRGRIWIRRLSVAAAIAVVAGMGVWLGRAAPSGSNTTPKIAVKSVQSMSTEALKASLANDFDILLAAMGDGGASESDSGDAGFQAEWIDELVEEGRAS